MPQPTPEPDVPQIRDFVPPPIRALRWRLPWMLATDAYARAPLRTAMRAAHFTFGELRGRDIDFRAPDGMTVRTMPNNFSSFAFCVDGTRDASIWRFIKTRVGPGNVFVDAGANIGTYAMPAARLVGPAGRVVAVEAHPRTFGYLRRNVEVNGLDQVEALNVALGEAPGHVAMQFNVANPGETHVDPDGAGSGTVRVPVRPLSDVLQDIGVFRVDYLKIDVEGFELPVLRGATRIIANSPQIAIQTELLERHAARYGYSIGEIATLLGDLGMRPYGIDAAGRAELLSGPVQGEVIWLHG